MSTSEPDQKKARKTKGLSEYITIIKDSILNSIDYIHEAIAEEIAKFTEDNLIECEDCCEQTVNINNPMNHCKNCGKIYCELCQKHELCNQGKHCLDCTKKEFIIECYQCSTIGKTQFIPKLCFKCEENGKHKEDTYFCNKCEEYQCNTCYEDNLKIRSFWECNHKGCYETICMNCYDKFTHEWSSCKCDNYWCKKHKCDDYWCNNIYMYRIEISD